MFSFNCFQTEVFNVKECFAFSDVTSGSSDEGLSLHAESRADPGGPLSLDSALQERLQQERASLQMQMELLEKKKNEEMQNLKTSLIAEQQVGVSAAFG